ncbi:helix-turn-helix domain-containing protein [Vibrio intestinalis]|uniref:helix-turn-helix domain-containing protein n=1 Tax=Vibrio intestinalis TaxID=2933291 RepID=UPI0021A316CB|nr:AraC family transcriptional regulator [Vibrio intestinalis]
MGSSVDKPWLIDDQYLDCPIGEQGKWRKHSLPLQAKQTEFLSAHICPDISCTVSECQFSNPYHSRIVYSKPTTLLVFGVEGISQFEFVTSQLGCTVRPGDVWLLSTAKDELLRTTPANTLSKMTVIKYATERINQAFHQSDEQPMQLCGSQMIRLGFQQSPEEWIAELVRNPMLSVSDRLLAEARALELIARWLTPVNQAQNEQSESNLQPVIDALIQNLAQPPSLDSLAKQAGMSHARLNRQFKSQFGKTVFEWLRQHRLERAKNYLANPDQAITDIALNCGFSSASHFTQTFKSQYGITPTEYRKGIEQGNCT